MPNKREDLPGVLRARCSAETRARLDYFIQKSGRKESDLVRDAVIEYLDREEPELRKRVAAREPLPNSAPASVDVQKLAKHIVAKGLKKGPSKPDTKGRPNGGGPRQTNS